LQKQLVGGDLGFRFGRGGIAHQDLTQTHGFQAALFANPKVLFQVRINLGRELLSLTQALQLRSRQVTFHISDCHFLQFTSGFCLEVI
jgi:hypothetical protein